MPGDLVEEHRDAALLASLAGRALVELRADPGDARDIGAAGDRLAHHLLVSELNRLYPADDVRSEEGLEHVAGAGRLWIVDPLDGTREFREVPRTDWAVHVAMAVGGQAVVGAVALPALEMVLSTAEPPTLPPYRRDDPPRLVVSRSRPPDVAYDVAEAIGAVLVPMGSAGAKIASVVLGDGGGLRARRRPVRVGLVCAGRGGDGERAARQPARRVTPALRRSRRLAARPRGVPAELADDVLAVTASASSSAVPLTVHAARRRDAWHAPFAADRRDKTPRRHGAGLVVWQVLFRSSCSNARQVLTARREGEPVR